ncbi:MAG: DUF4399 domain-containing protein [Bacteroidetes bacterium]|nr:DUF4399 domain-containing protein [Bacteroidota bacterium]
MKFRIILSMMALVALAACNNSGNDAAAKKDSTTANTSHDTMDHKMPSVGPEVPALPAVPEGAKVFFKNLKNDQTITLPFKIEMGAEKITVDTAGGPVAAGRGHHHLLIDGPDFIEPGIVIPKDSVHVHFGKGQTEYELKDLAPGKHKLVLQMGDALHRSYGVPLSAVVTVNVKK